MTWLRSPQMKSLIVSGLVIASALAACDRIWPSVRVHIHNSTGRDMRDTRLTITGHVALVGQVPSSAIRTGVLKPETESGMSLSFKDGQGRNCQQTVDVYLEHRYRGDLDLFVLSCESTRIEGFVTH